MTRDAAVWTTRDAVWDGILRREQKAAQSRKFAIDRHTEHNVLYDGGPFEVHLDAVTKILMDFGHGEPEMIAAGNLHDVIEDTPTSLVEIRIDFGLVVADLVDAVTDIKYSNDGKLFGNRRQRQEATYGKTRMYAMIHGDAPINLKLADRIANFRHSIARESSQLGMYVEEHEFFKAQLLPTGGDDAMWAELDRTHMDGVRALRAIRDRKRAERATPHPDVPVRRLGA